MLKPEKIQFKRPHVGETSPTDRSHPRRRGVKSRSRKVALKAKNIIRIPRVQEVTEKVMLRPRSQQIFIDVGTN